MPRGIKSVGDLQARCDVDEVSGCWRMWSRNGKRVRHVWYMAAGRSISLGALISQMTIGRGLFPDEVWRCTCETEDCANPAHRELVRRGQQVKSGMRRNPASIAKMTRTARSRSHLSDADVETIKASCETLKVIAARFGITPSYASLLRRGARRAPIAARSGSVFTWGLGQ